MVSAVFASNRAKMNMSLRRNFSALAGVDLWFTGIAWILGELLE